MKRDRADMAVAAGVTVLSGPTARAKINKATHNIGASYFYEILPLLTAHAKIGAGILIPLWIVS